MPLPSLPLIIDPFSSVLVFLRQGRVHDGHMVLLVPPAQSFCGHQRAMVPAPEQLLCWCGRCSSSQYSKQSHLKGLGNCSGVLGRACQAEGLERKHHAGGIGSEYQSLEIMQGTAPWWLKAPRSLEPIFKVGAQPGCCAIAEALRGSIKKSLLIMVVNQPEFRLLRQHTVQGSMRRWTCAVVPGGWELLGGCSG